MKKTRTIIRELDPATITELNDEQLVHVAGGSATEEFGSQSWTASWNCWDIDQPRPDNGPHEMLTE